MTETTLIRGARIDGGIAADILIRDGVIAELGSGLSAAGARTVDADGLIALPGLVDLHTHLREPGYEASETILTGSRAAAAGGYTTVFAMPNTSPVADTAGVVEQEYRELPFQDHAGASRIGMKMGAGVVVAAVNDDHLLNGFIRRAVDAEPESARGRIKGPALELRDPGEIHLENASVVE